MKCSPLPICLLVLAAGVAHAQQQEQGLVDRIDAKGKLAMQAMNGSSKSDPSLASPLSSKKFGATSVTMKNFDTTSFGGVKGASMKTFETRSFLGVKNPWFGKKIFDTYASQATGRSLADSSKQFQSDAFAVREYQNGRKEDLIAANAILPPGAQPRQYLGPDQPTKQQGISKFTQNLQKDLTIDEVRDLLNKGHGE